MSSPFFLFFINIASDKNDNRRLELSTISFEEKNRIIRSKGHSFPVRILDQYSRALISAYNAHSVSTYAVL